ncbi:hypothetical protein M3650_06030 [Paenibacillus sp. MER TA 81-3]|uniref:hypothetical protein n=1 Tax=Paenibacillus sp. MER TA 81-3 TaxID=2939573 RepID=UPI0020422D39|nr:hypothetical protein [Paenibacillus sp. MER TA 81-3]MCM3338204.1 hypothetical protein [Paenibacillus sp. MER TA 81-3]
MKKNVSILLVAILMLVSLLAGCSGQTAEDTPAPAEQKQTDNQNSTSAEGEGKESEPNSRQANTNAVTYDGEPVTLKFIISVDEETFKQRFKEQIELKFPKALIRPAD